MAGVMTREFEIRVSPLIDVASKTRSIDGWTKSSLLVTLRNLGELPVTITRGVVTFWVIDPMLAASAPILPDAIRLAGLESKSLNATLPLDQLPDADMTGSRPYGKLMYRLEFQFAGAADDVVSYRSEVLVL